MAKSCADLPEDDEELRKKLWLKIARHVVQEEKDVKKAMNCLSSCNLLKIEDILPFFPDFVTIDHFKVCHKVFPLIIHYNTLTLLGFFSHFIDCGDKLECHLQSLIDTMY